MSRIPAAYGDDEEVSRPLAAATSYDRAYDVCRQLRFQPSKVLTKGPCWGSGTCVRAAHRGGEAALGGGGAAAEDQIRARQARVSRAAGI